jgi:hypothetical protein
MKHFLFLHFILSGKILFAQFSVGNSISVSFRPQTDPGIYDHAIGAAIHIGYEPTAHLKLQVNAERQWVTSLMEKHRINTFYGEVKYSFLEGRTRPFIGFACGYAFENYEFPLDFGSMHNKGLLLSPAIGYLTDVGFIKKALVEVKLSYDNLYFHQRVDFIKGSVGLVYKFKGG